MTLTRILAWLGWLGFAWLGRLGFAWLGLVGWLGWLGSLPSMESKALLHRIDVVRGMSFQ